MLLAAVHGKYNVITICESVYVISSNYRHQQHRQQQQQRRPQHHSSVTNANTRNQLHHHETDGLHHTDSIRLHCESLRVISQ